MAGPGEPGPLPAHASRPRGVQSTFLKDTGQLNSKNPRGEREPPVSVQLKTQPHERAQCSPGRGTESTEAPCPASACSPAKMAATTTSHPERSTAEAGCVCVRAGMHSHRHMSTHMHTHAHRHTHTPRFHGLVIFEPAPAPSMSAISLPAGLPPSGSSSKPC